MRLKMRSPDGDRNWRLFMLPLLKLNFRQHPMNWHHPMNQLQPIGLHLADRKLHLRGHPIRLQFGHQMLADNPSDRRSQNLN